MSLLLLVALKLFFTLLYGEGTSLLLHSLMLNDLHSLDLCLDGEGEAMGDAVVSCFTLRAEKRLDLVGEQNSSV